MSVLSVVNGFGWRRGFGELIRREGRGDYIEVLVWGRVVRTRALFWGDGSNNGGLFEVSLLFKSGWIKTGLLFTTRYGREEQLMEMEMQMEMEMEMAQLVRRGQVCTSAARTQLLWLSLLPWSLA